jgi:hypothetical protein
MPIRANIVGPSCSATNVSVSIAFQQKIIHY